MSPITISETPYQWADSLGYHVTDALGNDHAHPLVPSEHLAPLLGNDNEDVVQLLSRGGELSQGPGRQAAIDLVAYARGAIEAGEGIVSCLEEAVYAWDRGRLGAAADALGRAYDLESEFGDAPLTDSVRDQMSLTVTLDALHDAHDADLPTSEAALSYYRALYERAAEDLAEELGMEITVLHCTYQGPDDQSEGPDEACLAAWQAIHDGASWPELFHYAEIDGEDTVARVWVSPHDAGHPDVRMEAGDCRWVYVEEPCELGDRLAVDDDGCARLD